MHERLVDELAANAAYIADIVDRVPDDALRRSVGDEWSVARVIGHVRAADSIWRPRILVALVHDGATMPDVDERALQAVLDGAGLTLHDQAHAFLFDRTELVWLLRSLPDGAWSRSFLHASKGEMAVIDAVDVVARHEREHLATIHAIAQGLTESFEPG